MLLPVFYEHLLMLLVQRTRYVLQNLQKPTTEKKTYICFKKHPYIPFFNVTQLLQNSFFISTIIEQNNLDHTLWNPERFSVLKTSILKFTRPYPSPAFNCDDHKGIRLIIRLHTGLSHLCEHKFKHNFQNCLNPICSVGFDIKLTSYFLLHCPIFNDKRYILLSTLHKIDCKLLELANSSLSQILFKATYYLIKKKAPSFLMQILNTLHPLKDSKSLLFQYSLQSLNPSEKFP